MNKRSKLDNFISIPDYWRDYVNANIDLRTDPKQACPFHHEQHGQSFSYSEEKGYWSCFGACHVLGGDVVRMHMLNYHIESYEKAEESLARLYGIKNEKEITFYRQQPKVDDREVKLRVAIAQAEGLATDPDSWVELDLIMSQYPPDAEKLQMFINQRKG